MLISSAMLLLILLAHVRRSGCGAGIAHPAPERSQCHLAAGAPVHPHNVPAQRTRTTYPHNAAAQRTHARAHTLAPPPSHPHAQRTRTHNAPTIHTAHPRTAPCGARAYRHLASASAPHALAPSSHLTPLLPLQPFPRFPPSFTFPSLRPSHPSAPPPSFPHSPCFVQAPLKS
eukprot:6206620-Pleurochrysis_carterae.AAC.2